MHLMALPHKHTKYNPKLVKLTHSCDYVGYFVGGPNPTRLSKRQAIIYCISRYTAEACRAFACLLIFSKGLPCQPDSLECIYDHDINSSYVIILSILTLFTTISIVTASSITLVSVPTLRLKYELIPD